MTRIKWLGLLQLAYFKAKQRFFSFLFSDVEDDVRYVLDHFFPRAKRSPLTTVSKPTLLKQHDVILNLCQYRLCTVTDRQHLAHRAQQAARISSKPVYIFRELLQYVIEQRLVAPGYTVLQDIIGHALTAEVQRLTTLIQMQLVPDDGAALDRLFADSEGLYTITRLKKAPTDFSLGEMRREIARGEELRPLYQLATRVLPHLAISNEGITYYATLVSYYSVFRLKQLAPVTVHLYLLCFVFHRYQQFHDHLLSCFIHLVKTYVDEAKATAKEQIYHYRLTSHQDMPKAAQVLKLFTTEQVLPGTPFEHLQAKAFAILDRERLDRVADSLATETTFDEQAFQWAHVDSMARRFKQHLRPLLRHVNLAATRANAPLLEVVSFLQATFESSRSLMKVDQQDVPTRFIPVNAKRYLYAQENAGPKRLIRDRYEFRVSTTSVQKVTLRNFVTRCFRAALPQLPRRSSFAL